MANPRDLNAPPAAADPLPRGHAADWLGSPEHPDANAVAAATRLDFDQVSGCAAMRSPLFLANRGDTVVGATLIFDAHLGYLLAVDVAGPRVGRYNRLVDPMETSRPALWRRREPERSGDAETLLCAISLSLLLRHRDVGLPLVLRGAGPEIALGLPAPRLQGFLSRVEQGVAMSTDEPPGAGRGVPS